MLIDTPLASLLKYKNDKKGYRHKLVISLGRRNYDYASDTSGSCIEANIAASSSLLLREKWPPISGRLPDM